MLALLGNRSVLGTSPFLPLCSVKADELMSK